jgi:hypothetical protein
LYQSYTWSYSLEVPPYDRLLAVLEAFFASYPNGDYDVDERDRYKLAFRRGMWKKSLLGLGPRVPEKLVPGEFTQWPVIVRVLVRPAPEVFTITVRYEVHLPRSKKTLKPETQAAVHLHAMKELEELAAYLAQCVPLAVPPEVNVLA